MLNSRYLLYISAGAVVFLFNFILVTALTGFSVEAFFHEYDGDNPWKPWMRLIVTAILLIVIFTTEVFAAVFALRKR